MANNIVNDNSLEVNNLPNNVNNNNVPSCAGLNYSTNNQLRKAQDRRVMCNGSTNANPVQGYEGVQSAQGYGAESPVTGFNESGHESINYLCLGR